MTQTHQIASRSLTNVDNFIKGANSFKKNQHLLEIPMVIIARIPHKISIHRGASKHRIKLKTLFIPKITVFKIIIKKKQRYFYRIYFFGDICCPTAVLTKNICLRRRPPPHCHDSQFIIIIISRTSSYVPRRALITDRGVRYANRAVALGITVKTRKPAETCCTAFATIAIQYIYIVIGKYLKTFNESGTSFERAYIFLGNIISGKSHNPVVQSFVLHRIVYRRYYVRYLLA